LSDGNHDTLVYRLSGILIKLNQGLSLDAKLLADEFGVSLRTIQRDLNVRFAYLPLQKEGNKYHLDAAFKGKLNNVDIKHFASLAGVRGLFPSLSDLFLRDVFNQRMESAFLVKGHHYEDLTGKEGLFQALEKAIYQPRLIDFDYDKKHSIKHYAAIEPYKLMNHKGIWYLAAKDEDKLKTFSFSRVQQLRVSNTPFTPDSDVQQTLIQEEGIWFTADKKEIVMIIAQEVAGYFKRRQLIANQVIQEEREDGSLLVSAKVGHVNQVLPIVRYWLPHIHIIRPEGLQDELETAMLDYIKQNVKGSIKHEQ